MCLGLQLLLSRLPQSNAFTFHSPHSPRTQFFSGIPTILHESVHSCLAASTSYACGAYPFKTSPSSLGSASLQFSKYFHLFPSHTLAVAAHTVVAAPVLHSYTSYDSGQPHQSAS